MSKVDVCIVGGGLMGLALARKLVLDNCRVTVIESGSQPGGLATWHNFGDFVWDRFYHVILPSDIHLIGLIRELGLGDELEWRRTYTGFYVDNKLHSISSNLEFLQFPLLPLFAKIRLAFTMLYGSRISDWRALESVTAEDWLVRISGRTNFEKLWRPLLLAKLGGNYQRVSAVFIWSYIKRMFSARDSSASSESLGHVRGGYRQIFSKIIDSVESNGGLVETECMVKAIRLSDDDRLQVETENGSRNFDKVICTSPVSVMRRIVDDSLISIDDADGDVEYLGVVCVVIVTDRPIVPYYVVNIADDRIPFTGIIGMSNVVSPANTAGKHLTYLPKYILSTDDELNMPDRYFEERFVNGLQTMFPEFEAENILSIHVHRARKVQPLQVVDYSSLVPNVTTRHRDFYVLNTAQFVNATLNNNEVIATVNRFHDLYKHDLAA